MTRGAEASPPLPLVARVSHVAGHEFTTFEPRDLDALLDARVRSNAIAPYGAVTWPTARAVAALVAARPLEGVTLVDVGAGSGLVSIVAATRGARVLALDVDDTSAVLVDAAARHAGVDVAWASFDVTSRAPLPDGDLVVFADLLYEPPLAGAVARRAIEALARGSRVVVGDPGRAGRAAFASLVRDAGLDDAFVETRVLGEGGDMSVGLWERAP